MNEITMTKQLFKAPKDKTGWIYTILIIICIVVGLLAIFWPSQKPVKASDIPLMYQNDISALGTYDQYSRQVSIQKNTTSTFNGKIKQVILWPYGNCDYAGSWFYFEPYIFNLTTGGGCSFTYATSTKTPSGACIFNVITSCYLDTDGLVVNEGDLLRIATTNTTNGDGATNPSNRWYGSASDVVNGVAYAGTYTSWDTVNQAPITGVADLAFQLWGATTTEEYIPPTEPNLTITSPADGSTQTTNFDIEADYDLLEIDYQRAMIIFEDWEASSTCPIFGTQNYTDEMALGYFNNQSQPYFSDYFEASTGTTSIAVSDIARGSYRCVRCYFINETQGTISPELCNGYGIEIPNTLLPTIPTYYTGQNWATFYTENGDKWATSTELFAFLAGKTAPLLSWVGNFTADFKNLFNNASSSAMGQQIGGAIPKARGYLTIINYYFAGIPIGEVFIFYILTALILIVLKIVLMMWHFFRG